MLSSCKPGSNHTVSQKHRRITSIFNSVSISGPLKLLSYIHLSKTRANKETSPTPYNAISQSHPGVSGWGISSYIIHANSICTAHFECPLNSFLPCQETIPLKRQLFLSHICMISIYCFRISFVNDRKLLTPKV